MTLPSDEFAPVPLRNMIPDEELATDVYLKINDKFVKYLDRGGELSGEKLNQFISKGLNDLFVKMTELPTFMDWYKNLRKEKIDQIVEEVGEEFRPFVEKREEIVEKVYDTYSDLEMDSATVQILQSQVKEFIGEIQREKVPAAVIAKIARQSESIAEHSVNTAHYAIFMAMVLGHGNHSILENLYCGALFHDYAKAKIPVEILDNIHNIKYNQAIQNHPHNGATSISKIKEIDEQVVKIVEQHHESFNGKGYPKGLKGDEIFGLTKIVSMANIFDNSLMENSHRSQKEKFKTAIKVLEYDRGKQFDPELVEKVLEGLELAFGHYIK